MISSDDIIKAFVSAGFDTPEKLTAIINQFSLQAQIKQLDLQVDGLSAKRAEATKPLDDERTELLNQRAALVQQLTA